MLSRMYALFVGIVFIILAIGGYSSDTFMGASDLGSLTPTIWLLTGLVSLAVGFFVRNVNTLRTFAAVVGALYLLWGVIGLIGDSGLRDVLLTITSILGALGLACALAPAQWIREREIYAHG